MFLLALRHLRRGTTTRRLVLRRAHLLTLRQLRAGSDIDQMALLQCCQARVLAVLPLLAAAKGSVGAGCAAMLAPPVLLWPPASSRNEGPGWLAAYLLQLFLVLAALLTRT